MAKKEKQKSTPKDRNREALERHQEELLANHEGKFALFADGELVDTFDTFMAAYEHGVDECGLEEFFIHPIQKDATPEQLPALQHGLIHAHL